MIIDASSQWIGIWPSGQPGIILDGSGAGSGFVNGLWINGADNCHIRGLFITGFGACGVFINSGGQYNTIGGIGAGYRNVLSGNGLDGVTINDTETNYNMVSGNYIGTDMNGTADLGNLEDGVRIGFGAYAISGNGLAVVGYGTNPNGQTEAWIAYLPPISPPNTPAGINVEVQPIDEITGFAPVTLSFDNITEAGSTSLRTSGVGPPPPSGFRLGSPPTYYQITTTAAFSGAVQICVDYSGVSFGNERNLRMRHFSHLAEH